MLLFGPLTTYYLLKKNQHHPRKHNLTLSLLIAQWDKKDKNFTFQARVVSVLLTRLSFFPSFTPGPSAVLDQQHNQVPLLWTNSPCPALICPPPCSPPDSNGDISQPILQHLGESFLPQLRCNLEVSNTGKQILLPALMQSLISQPR